jgi:hypothetical protein
MNDGRKTHVAFKGKAQFLLGNKAVFPNLKLQHRNMRKLMLAVVCLMMLSEMQAQPKAKLTDDQLLDLVQKQTFRYFWDFGHPVSGLSRERSNIAYEYGHEVVTTGGTGFGIMAIVVASERKWITREQSRGADVEDGEVFIQGRSLPWDLPALAKW